MPQFSTIKIENAQQFRLREIMKIRAATDSDIQIIILVMISNLLVCRDLKPHIQYQKSMLMHGCSKNYVQGW
jgi:hypothetical protein